MRTGRYGASNRKLVENARKKAKKRYECKKCGKIKVKRKSNSIWVCNSCGAIFAGGAYSFTTETGEVFGRVLSEYSKASKS